MTGTEGEGVRAALQARAAVEEAIALLPQVPVAFERAPVGESLRRAIHSMYLVIDSQPDAPAHVEGLMEGAAVVGEVRQSLRPLAARGAIEALDVALDRLALAESALRLGLEVVLRDPLPATRRASSVPASAAPGRRSSAPPRGRELRASIGVPELHWVPRQPLVRAISLEPVVDVGDDALPSTTPGAAPPPPRTLDELTAMASQKAADVAARYMAEEAPAPEEASAAPLEWVSGFEPASSEMEVLRRVARDCLEDIAIHRDLRKPNELETWLDQAPFEQRLLDNLDAFVAVGPAALAQVVPFWAEAPAPDPGRAFAAALVLGCVEGRDTVDTAVALLAEAAPETHPGWVEGWSLATNPHIDLAMLELLQRGAPDLWPVALEVLASRGSHPPLATLERVAREASPAGLSALASALGSIGERDGSIALLLDLAGRGAGVEIPAVTSLLRRGHPPARGVLRQWLSSSDPVLADAAAWLLALAGESSDLQALLMRASASPSLAAVRGLGRFGHIEAVPLLLDLLSHADEEIALAAGEALELITARGLVERVEVPWVLDVPEELLERGADVPTRHMSRIVTDRATWERALRDPSLRFDGAVRYRRGEPFHPRLLAVELASRDCPPPRRVEAELELTIVTGFASVLSTTDWVARQKAALDGLASRIASAGFAVGEWGFARRPSAGPSSGEVLKKAALGATVSFNLQDMLAKAAVPFSAVAPTLGSAAPPPKTPRMPEAGAAAPRALGATLPPSTARGSHAPARPVLPFQSSPSTAPAGTPDVLGSPAGPPPHAVPGAPAAPRDPVAPAQPGAPLGSAPQPAPGAPRRVTALDRTMPSDGGRARRDALPFLAQTVTSAKGSPAGPPSGSSASTSGSSAPPEPLARPSPIPPNPRRLGDTRPSTLPDRDALPFLPTAAGGASAVADPSGITLDQYAWLVAIADARPDEHRELRARVGLADEAAWARCNRSFSERFDRDTSLRHQFGRLLVTYHDWIKKGR